MIISAKRHDKLYKAISDPIMDLRVINTKNRLMTVEEMDQKLFNLEMEIYRKIRDALDLHKNEN